MSVAQNLPLLTGSNSLIRLYKEVDMRQLFPSPPIRLARITKRTSEEVKHKSRYEDLVCRVRQYISDTSLCGLRLDELR
ncbi:MAG: hypothetical protein KBT66_16520 [Amphritea sp.]|nr:hypothetical protein [Amphritea sp.]